jgi:hypothetical protein
MALTFRTSQSVRDDCRAGMKFVESEKWMLLTNAPLSWTCHSGPSRSDTQTVRGVFAHLTLFAIPDNLHSYLLPVSRPSHVLEM